MTYDSCTRRLITGSNKMNFNSSRSHSIFTVQLECFNEIGMRVCSSRLNLVDLAGSERLEFNGISAKTKEESININKSLFNLKKVMTALAEGSSSSHVPFRDSKLTCLLQQTLGGSGSCLMVDFKSCR
jgi:Kinesin motor domain